MAPSDLSSAVTASQLSTEIVPFSSSTYLPTKLTESNFLVWRKQLKTSLFDYNLQGYVDGTLPTPPSRKKDKTTNPDYYFWQHQDQFILNAMLGSCGETIQPSIPTATCSKDAWDRLKNIFSNKSRTRVLSLKPILMQNPRNNRPIVEYLKEMRQIADALTLADSPLFDENFFISVITQLGPEFNAITSSLRL
nr:PREDICTED: uncharacterized protein LOC108207314 [Daucus carota subsp. sativus]